MQATTTAKERNKLEYKPSQAFVVISGYVWDTTMTYAVVLSSIALSFLMVTKLIASKSNQICYSISYP